MWRSKQASSATAFSPALVSTATIDPPVSGPDTEVKTKISENEDLCVDGVVESPMFLKCRTLTVAPAAKVTAFVIAQDVIIFGELNGNLQARNRIQIKKDASVLGDLTTPRILIEDGAHFKGTVQIERRKSPRP